MKKFATAFLVSSALVSAFAYDYPDQIRYYDRKLDKFAGDFDGIDANFRSLIHAPRPVGVEPFVTYWADFLGNPVGGEAQGFSFTHLLVFGGRIDLEHIIGWNDAKLVISATDVAGSNLSQTVGNVFTLSQAYLMNTFALYNLYLEQNAFDDQLQIKIGRMSAGQLFATLPAMGLPVSGAVNGNPTSLFLNSPFTATGVATWAAFAKWQPSDQFYLDAGAFQATPRLGDPTYHGVDFGFRSGDGVLVMVEGGWTPTFKSGAGAAAQKGGGKISVEKSLEYPGIYTLGGYFSAYEFERFSGGDEPISFGFYGVAQQEVWQSASDENRNLTLWGGLTYAPQEQIAQMPWMGFAGVGWQGAVPARPLDTTMLALYAGNFSKPYADAQVAAGGARPTVETVLEASYIIQITENIQIQPDVQWVIQPYGRSSVPSALVIGFQFAATY